MGTVTVLQLPQATNATGAEQVEATQNGRSVRLTTAQIAQLAQSVVPTGPVGLVVGVPAAGANNNFNAGGLIGATTGFLDLAPTVACNITGITAGFDGQVLIVTLTTAVACTLNARNAGSIAANQLRMIADAILTQWNSRTFKYSASIGMWVALS